MVSSINFALKSAEEQQAIIQAYMQFLNSIEYPMQIVIQSRKLNIDKYLERLRVAEKEQPNELLKMQISDYRSYITELVEIGSIMTKKFYLVVSYDPLSDKKKSFFSRVTEIFAPASFIKLAEEKFQQRKRELFQRLSHISSSLASIGLESRVLNTELLIELFYNSYNPDLVDVEKIKDINEIQAQ
jgi:hypothetical protein